jgi:hypothetical protein
MEEIEEEEMEKVFADDMMPLDWSAPQATNQAVAGERVIYFLQEHLKSFVPVHRTSALAQPENAALTSHYSATRS